MEMLSQQAGKLWCSIAAMFNLQQMARVSCGMLGVVKTVQIAISISNCCSGSSTSLYMRPGLNMRWQRI